MVKISKVLLEKYDIICEENSLSGSTSLEDIERENLYKKIFTSDTFEDFEESYKKLFKLQRKTLNIMPSAPMVAIFDFIKDKPELGNPKFFKNTPAENLYNALTNLNSYFELTLKAIPMVPTMSQLSRLQWAEEDWNKWYAAYKVWKDSRAELYKDNPGVNIDI